MVVSALGIPFGGLGLHLLVFGQADEGLDFSPHFRRRAALSTPEADGQVASLLTTSDLLTTDGDPWTGAGRRGNQP